MIRVHINHSYTQREWCYRTLRINAHDMIPKVTSYINKNKYYDLIRMNHGFYGNGIEPILPTSCRHA